MFLSRPNEKLEQHINECLNQLNRLRKIGKLDTLNNIICKMTKNKEVEKVLIDLVEEVVKLHDKGKENPYFQNYIGNDEFKQYKFTDNNKQHSIVSAAYFLEKNLELLKIKGLKKDDKRLIRDIVLSLAYIISRHHSNLENFDGNDFIDKIQSLYKTNKEMFLDVNVEKLDKYIDTKYKYDNSFAKYIYTKFTYSLLVTCDFLAVYKFYNEKDLDFNLIDNNLANNFKEKLNNNEIVTNIRSFQNGNLEIVGVNKYRTEMFLESEDNLLRNKDNNIFYLEAPTGSGKSITSLNLSLNLIDKNYNKIYYVAPFLNILDQTYKDVKSFIGENTKDIVLVNSKEEIVAEGCYEQDYLDSQLLNYSFTILSHVRLFDILFSNSRSHNLMLPLISNSVIILDEIQSYKNELWINIINSLKEYAELLNIKIIIMSATLPKMQQLIEDVNFKTVDLINRVEYYREFFKTRVKADFSMLNLKEEFILENIEEKINNSERQRILIGLIKVKTADEYFDYFNSKYGEEFKVFEITGNTKSKQREEIIRLLKAKDNNGEYIEKKVILIATQCVEAGVDIDMNIGFKNISILDSDEQFCGRIERNFKNEGIVYFFKNDDSNKIYKNDYRSEKTLLDSEWRQLFQDKNFGRFYERNYRWLKEDKDSKYKEFKKMLNDMKFNDIYKEMELISDLKETLFLHFNYKDEDTIISSHQVLKDMGRVIAQTKSEGNYAKMKIEVSKLRKLIDIFTYQVNTYDLDKINVTKEQYGYYIVDDASRFIDNLDSEGNVVYNSVVNLEKMKQDQLIY